MSTLRQFEELSERELQEIYMRKRRVTLLISRSTAGVGELDKAGHPSDMPDYAEIPPTPMILTNEGAAAAYVHSSGGPDGRWLRGIVLVYRLGGRILYRDLGNDVLEVVIDFRQPRIGERVIMASGPWPIVNVTEHKIEVCPYERCIPTATGHNHTLLNRGLLTWDRDVGHWRLPGRPDQ